MSDVLLQAYPPSNEPVVVVTSGIQLALWKNTVSDLTEMTYSTSTTEQQQDDEQTTSPRISLNGLQSDLMNAVSQLSGDSGGHAQSELLNVQVIYFIILHAKAWTVMLVIL